MTCPNCGFQSRPGAMFCGSCAYRLDGSAAPPPPALITPPPPLGPPVLPTTGGELLPPQPAPSAPLPPPPGPPAPTLPTGWSAPRDAQASPPPPGFITAPPAAPDVQPAAAASVPLPPPPLAEADESESESESESDDEFDATVVSDRRSASGWKIVLADGSQQGVSGQVLVGRQVKVADPRWPTARLLSVVDTTKSVSKVHALLEADASGFWITDLGSTNGVIISLADGNEVDLDGKSRGEVPPGSEIVLGNYVLKVDKS